MKIEIEKRVVEKMIRIYCRKKEGNDELCSACTELLDYAMARLSHCKFGDEKGACKDCKIHCYKPEMREQIRAVMRFSGPRMMIYSPVMSIRHLLNK